MDMDDGGYLGAYRRFFIDFVEKINPDDQLPAKIPTYDITEDEIVGEIIDMTLQYLNQKYCPLSLQSHLVHIVIEEMQTIRRHQPESCGRKLRDNTYAPLRLMQAVTGKVYEICKRYLENSRLALLPPPPSTPPPVTTVCTSRNSRRKMEDRHVILHDLNAIFNIKNECVNYYAVFDGHAGQDAAVYCTAHLHQYLCESVYYPTDMERALRDAFVTTDAHFTKKCNDYNLSSGSTAVCAVIFKNKLYVAWVGDSQAALVKQGNANQLVKPHTAARTDEQERVQQMGGNVLYFGMWRVDGNLAVSRAIGDPMYKPHVTADPDVTCIDLDGTEDFLILASDGVWDVLGENEAAEIVYKKISQNPRDCEAVSQQLVDSSKALGSTDNITVIVVFLTSPSQIAARLINTHPLSTDVHLDNMDEDNRYFSNANGQYDVQTSFIKQVHNHTNGSNLDEETTPFAYGKSSNGKHENGTVEYDDENDDDDDLGPETDVDAVDDAAEINTLANVSRELFPDKDSADDLSGDNTIDDVSSMFPSITTKQPQNELIAEPENVGDSEDSDDEWNYYKVDPNKEKANSSESPDLKEQSECVDNKLLNDVEVSTLQQEGIFVSEKEKQQQLEDNEIDSCSDSGAESEREVCSNELINTEINEATIEEPAIAHVSDDNSEDMDFQLNPDAAEFVPVSPIIPSRLMDRPISGSPLKHTSMMDDIRLPSPKEFSEEANHRPHEVEGKEDMINSSNGDFVMVNVNVEVDNQKSTSTLDESEIFSSTRAEFGDESTASFLTTADYHKNDGMDGSFTDSCAGTCDNEPMMMSFGPDLYNPLGNPVDLNAVHDLSDTDLCDQDDQTVPKQGEDWDESMCNFVKDEKRDVHSPDDHPELVDLISPESDQPVHSVAFPDHENSDLLGASSTILEDNLNTDVSHGEIENVTSEVAAMNLKNEQLSEVQCVKEESDDTEFTNVNNEIEEMEKPTEQSSYSDILLPSLQPPISTMEIDDSSSPVLQPSKSSLEYFSEETVEIPDTEAKTIQQQYPVEDLMSNDIESPIEKSDIIESEVDIVKEIHSFASTVETFKNPLDINFSSNPTSELPYTSNNIEDKVEVNYLNDDGPTCPQFDCPSVDEPFSRSLSSTPDHQEKHVQPEECESAIEQSQVSETNTEFKLSESLQEFTGLESELTPLTNGNVINAEIQSYEVANSEAIVKEKCEESQENNIPLVDNEIVVSEIEEKPIIVPEEVEIGATVVAVTTAVAAGAAVTSAAIAAKPKSTTKSPPKTATKTATTKSSNKLSPTSPIKALISSTTSRPASSPITKKTPTSTTPRSKLSESATKVSPANKSQVTKSTAKPSPRMNVVPKPKTNTTSTTTTTLKSSSAITERKSTTAITTNGETKSQTTKSASKPKSTTTTTTTGAATKPLVKSTTSRPATIKSKPIGSTSTKIGAKAPTTVTSTIGGGATTTTTTTTRPKTAPATLGVTKTRVQSTTKSPVLDKQIKETANKQISSSRTSTTATATKISRTTNSLTSTTVTSTTTSMRRTAATAPAKKSMPTTRISAKSATAVSKTSTKNSNPKVKVQNGVCEMTDTKTISSPATTAIETTITTMTTTTTTNEQDILQKDASPIESSTDNQLLITAD